MKHRLGHNGKTVDATLITSERSTCVTKPIRLPSLLMYGCVLLSSQLLTFERERERDREKGKMRMGSRIHPCFMLNRGIKLERAMHSRRLHLSTLRRFANKKGSTLAFFCITEDQTLGLVRTKFEERKAVVSHVLLDRRWWSKRGAGGIYFC